MAVNESRGTVLVTDLKLKDYCQTARLSRTVQFSLLLTCTLLCVVHILQCML